MSTDRLADLGNALTVVVYGIKPFSGAAIPSHWAACRSASLERGIVNEVAPIAPILESVEEVKPMAYLRILVSIISSCPIDTLAEVESPHFVRDRTAQVVRRGTPTGYGCSIDDTAI